MKINKGRIIKKVLAPELEKRGFEYTGYKNKSWIFINHRKEVEQQIVILEHRYDNSKFTFLMIGMKSIRGASLDDLMKPTEEYWEAKNEDEFEKICHHFLELMQLKGFEMLKEASVVSSEQRILNKISKEVYENRDTIYRRVLTRFPKIATSEFSIEAIDEWFDIFEIEYSFYKKGSVEKFNAKDMAEYEEVIVFLSKMLEIHLCGVWYKHEGQNIYSVSIEKMNALNRSINVVNALLTGIRKKSIKGARHHLKLIICRDIILLN